jgi:hypothetical protein
VEHLAERLVAGPGSSQSDGDHPRGLRLEAAPAPTATGTSGSTTGTSFALLTSVPSDSAVKTFPEALKSTAPARWYGHAAFALANADTAAARGDVTYCVGLLTRAAIAAAQARLAEQGRWALNEKGITTDAGLGEVEALLGSPGRSREGLKRLSSASAPGARSRFQDGLFLQEQSLWAQVQPVRGVGGGLLLSSGHG